jgi:N-acylglucosamine-6-phosphate 2-epimerase
MLFVSCQSEKGSPFNSLKNVINFANAAKIGGAHGIRSEGVIRTKAVIKSVDLPVIGLVKRKFSDGFVGITITERDFVNLLGIGCKIIAVDGTSRIRDGLSGHEYIKYLKGKYECKIMADISTLEEAHNCALAGVDYISTTLNGYTPWTLNENTGNPNFMLVENILNEIKNIPIIAEGRINSPIQAKLFIQMGCSFVVVGSAITRPHLITKSYVDMLIK